MNLEKIRKEIDEIDIEIQDLLEKRFSLVLQALKYKKKVLDKKREEEILNKISSPYIRDIFKTILKTSKKKQRLHFN
jgi:chorismate mutase